MPRQKHSQQLATNLLVMMREKKLIDATFVDKENNKTGVHQIVLAGIPGLLQFRVK
jgi:hypothetical protein